MENFQENNPEIVPEPSAPIQNNVQRKAKLFIFAIIGIIFVGTVGFFVYFFSQKEEESVVVQKDQDTVEKKVATIPDDERWNNNTEWRGMYFDADIMAVLSLKSQMAWGCAQLPGDNCVNEEMNMFYMFFTPDGKMEYFTEADLMTDDSSKKARFDELSKLIEQKREAKKEYERDKYFFIIDKNVFENEEKKKYVKIPEIDTPWQPVFDSIDPFALLFPNKKEVVYVGNNERIMNTDGNMSSETVVRSKDKEVAKYTSYSASDMSFYTEYEVLNMFAAPDENGFGYFLMYRASDLSNVIDKSPGKACSPLLPDVLPENNKPLISDEPESCSRSAYTVYYNGTYGDNYEWIHPQSIQVSPDGKHILYTVMDFDTGEESAVIDHKKFVAEGKLMANPTLSDDGTAVEFYELRGKDIFHVTEKFSN